MKATLTEIKTILDSQGNQLDKSYTFQLETGETKTYGVMQKKLTAVELAAKKADAKDVDLEDCLARLKADTVVVETENPNTEFEI